MYQLRTRVRSDWKYSCMEGQVSRRAQKENSVTYEEIMGRHRSSYRINHSKEHTLIEFQELTNRRKMSVPSNRLPLRNDRASSGEQIYARRAVLLSWVGARWTPFGGEFGNSSCVRTSKHNAQAVCKIKNGVPFYLNR